MRGKSIINLADFKFIQIERYMPFEEVEGEEAEWLEKYQIL